MAAADPLLKISNSPVLQQFLHECVDDLIGTREGNFDNYNSDIEWTIDDFKKARKFIQSLYRQGAINDNLEIVPKDIAADVQEAIKNCFEVRKNDIFQALMRENVIKKGHNLVENFDWKLKWVMGSSKLSTIREPLVQVDLYCYGLNSENAKLQKNTVNFEANLVQLDNFIEELNRVKSEIEKT